MENKFVACGIYKFLCLINLQKNSFCFTRAILFSGQQAIYTNSHYVSHSKLQSPLTIQWYVYDVYTSIMSPQRVDMLTDGRFEGGTVVRNQSAQICHD